MPLLIRIFGLATILLGSFACRSPKSPERVWLEILKVDESGVDVVIHNASERIIRFLGFADNYPRVFVEVYEDERWKIIPHGCGVGLAEIELIPGQSITSWAPHMGTDLPFRACVPVTEGALYPLHNDDWRKVKSGLISAKRQFEAH